MSSTNGRPDDAWYVACVARIEELERHVAHGGTLASAVEPWCALCAAAAAALERLEDVSRGERRGPSR